jgi:Zn-finger nucleic acid-binding protein
MRASSQWEVLACMACGGVWADAEASRRIATTVDREIVSIAKRAATHAAESEPRLERLTPDGARACPVCGGALRSVRSGHVPVDVCAPHGTWFDRDELGRLARNLEFERLSLEPSPPSSGAEPTSRTAEMLLDLLGRQP